MLGIALIHWVHWVVITVSPVILLDLQVLLVGSSGSSGRSGWFLWLVVGNFGASLAVVSHGQRGQGRRRAVAAQHALESET
jgi:hypothetical protein